MPLFNIMGIETSAKGYEKQTLLESIVEFLQEPENIIEFNPSANCQLVLANVKQKTISLEKVFEKYPNFKTLKLQLAEELDRSNYVINLNE